MNKEQEIKYYKKYFRILKDWRIEYDTINEYKAQTNFNAQKRKATIYQFRVGSGRTPNDYILYEMLHIALAEIYGSKTKKEKNKEEGLVSAICGLISYYKRRNKNG